MENWFLFSPHDDHSIAVLQLITMFYEGFIFLLVVVNKSECQWIRSNIRRASAKKHSNKATASKCLISEYVLRLYTREFLVMLIQLLLQVTWRSYMLDWWETCCDSCTFPGSQTHGGSYRLSLYKVKWGHWML